MVALLGGGEWIRGRSKIIIITSQKFIKIWIQVTRNRKQETQEHHNIHLGHLDHTIRNGMWTWRPGNHV